MLIWKSDWNHLLLMMKNDADPLMVCGGSVVSALQFVRLMGSIWKCQDWIFLES